MGCDIHLYVEVRKKGKWTSADKWVKEEDGRTEWSIDYNSRFYDGRNYDLFAILADVRNGRGFAGTDTGNGFVPIAQPRGIPEDASPRVKAEAEAWNGDGHSHSHFTLAEIFAYDWTQRTKKRGWVNGMQYAEWVRWRKDHGEGPESYCGGVGGSGVSHLSTEDMDKKLKEIQDPIQKKYKDNRQQAMTLIDDAVRKQLGSAYCVVEWEVSYHDSARFFWSDLIPKLLHLGKPEDVRIVFFFDN